MTEAARGRLLDQTASGIEASEFARESLPAVRDPARPDPRWVNLARQTWLLRVAQGVELEALFSDEGLAEVVSLAIPRGLLQDKGALAPAVALWARFLASALGELPAADKKPVGDLLAVNYDMTRTFEPLCALLPFIPKDGSGAATEVFLGRRMEASSPFASKQATLIVRNDERGRLLTSVATQKAVFDLGSLLFQAPVRFAGGERGALLGWLAPDVEATPFGRRFGLDLDRTSPPKGRIARRYFGFTRFPRSAKVEVLTSPTRGIAGVWLKVDQGWVEESDTNFFAALELVAAFLSGCLGDPPEPAAREQVAGFFACDCDDDDLFAVLKRELPGARKGDMGEGLSVFLGDEERASVLLDDGKVALVLNENDDGWLDVLLHRVEMGDDIGAPAVSAKGGA
ncbi:MAG: hypothetical protein R3A52_15760 [Polyangiales bacterium]